MPQNFLEHTQVFYEAPEKILFYILKTGVMALQVALEDPRDIAAFRNNNKPKKRWWIKLGSTRQYHPHSQFSSE
jgi:hypothetical protein